MRLWLLAALVLVMPIEAHAGNWCSVPPADAKASLAQLVRALQPKLDSEPAPMAAVHTEGTLPHQGIRDASLAAERDWPTMRDAAYAWRAGAGDDYHALATRYFERWIDIYKPSFNPIDETNLDALIETYAMIAPTLTPSDRAAAQAFIRAWAKGYVAAMDSHHASSMSPKVTIWNNNWQSHRVKLVTLMAVALNDEDLFRAARRLFQAQIAVNIHADGEVIDFAERDALHYVLYDIEPLARAALAARLHGEDWFNFQAANGASLVKAFAWLKPYADGEKQHEEFRRSQVTFDAERAAAGEKGYSGPFDPATAGGVMWLGAAFDPSYRAIAQKLKPSPPVWLAICGS